MGAEAHGVKSCDLVLRRQRGEPWPVVGLGARGGARPLAARLSHRVLVLKYALPPSPTMASDPDAEAKIHKALEQAVEGGQGDFKMTQEVRGAGGTGRGRGRARPRRPAALLRRRRAR